MDESVFDRIFSVAAAAWVAVVMLAVRLFRTWPLVMEQINTRKRDAAIEKEGDWDRLRKERDRLRELLTTCEKERIEWMGRAITAEATLQGYGDAHQRAAEIVAAERLKDARKREGG